MSKGCSEKGYSQFSWGEGMRASSNPLQSIQRRTHTHTFAYMQVVSSGRRRRVDRLSRNSSPWRRFAMLAGGGFKANWGLEFM
jgi:hypothetical protein